MATSRGTSTVVGRRWRVPVTRPATVAVGADLDALPGHVSEGAHEPIGSGVRSLVSSRVVGGCHVAQCHVPFRKDGRDTLHTTSRVCEERMSGWESIGAASLGCAAVPEPGCGRSIHRCTSSSSGAAGSVRVWPGPWRPAGHTVAIIDRQEKAFRRLPEEFTGPQGRRRRLRPRPARRRPASRRPGPSRPSPTATTPTSSWPGSPGRPTASSKVVARIYDPRRAAIYERLGIATIATVQWATERVLRRILPDSGDVEWIDPSAKVVLDRAAGARRPRSATSSRELEVDRARPGRGRRPASASPSCPRPTSCSRRATCSTWPCSATSVDELDAHLAGAAAAKAVRHEGRHRRWRQRRHVHRRRARQGRPRRHARRGRPRPRPADVGRRRAAGRHVAGGRRLRGHRAGPSRRRAGRRRRRRHRRRRGQPRDLAAGQAGVRRPPRRRPRQQPEERVDVQRDVGRRRLRLDAAPAHRARRGGRVGRQPRAAAVVRRRPGPPRRGHARARLAGRRQGDRRPRLAPRLHGGGDPAQGPRRRAAGRHAAARRRRGARARHRGQRGRGARSSSSGAEATDGLDPQAAPRRQAAAPRPTRRTSASSRSSPWRSSPPTPSRRRRTRPRRSSTSSCRSRPRRRSST